MKVGLVAAICALVAAVAASASPATRELPDCLGKPHVRPVSVVFACGDGNFGVDHLTWVAWGGPRAFGIGSAYANDCKPYCAAGHFKRYRAVLIASGSQRCPNGTPAYMTVTYAFIGRSPFPTAGPGTSSPHQVFPCRKMP